MLYLQIHCCFIGIGYWCYRTRESSKILWSRGKYSVLLNFNLNISICWSISWTSHSLQGWYSSCTMEFLCYHCFQLTSHIACNACVNHRCDERFHFVDIITVYSFWVSSHCLLIRPMRKLVQFVNLAHVEMSRPSSLVWMDDKRIAVDVVNRAAVIPKPWLFVDSFIVLLVFLLTHWSLIPIVF